MRVSVYACVRSTLRMHEKQHTGMLGPTLPTPCLGYCSPGSFPSPLMKRFFMSYSHPVLTTTIVSLPGPHVSHHQWDPNVADKIISLPLCCNHIPSFFKILLCLPLLGESHTQTTISLLLHISLTALHHLSLPFLPVPSPLLAISKITALLGLPSTPGVTS